MTTPLSPVPMKLLMLSHCLPASEGSPARVRAWQLLRWAARTHQVYLAAVGEGPFHLEHWRQLRRATAQIIIEPFSIRRRPWATGLAGWNSIQSRLALIDQRLQRGTQPWRLTPFDAVLCTHPMLWSQIDHLKFRHGVCDLAIPASLQHEQAAQERRGLRRWWHQRQAILHRQLELTVARRCHWLLLQRASDAVIYQRQPCEVLILPSLDPSPPMSITGQRWSQQETAPVYHRLRAKAA